MKNKLLSLILAAVMMVAFSGCIFVPTEIPHSTNSTENTEPTEEQYDGYTLVDRAVFEFDCEYYDAVTLSAGYESLTEDSERECYKQIDKHVYYIADDIDGETWKTLPITLEDTKLSEAQIRLVIAAYFLDNPQVFWIHNNFVYSNTTDNTVIQLLSYMSAEVVTATAQNLSREVEEVLSGVTADMDLFTRELYVHDMLIQRCEYIDDLSVVDDSFRAYTTLGALVDSKAVCEGYSRTMQLLLSELSIESYNVLGEGTDTLHMWNCVKLGDEWYYVDATWDDEDEDGVVYDYFNITTEQILADHTINSTYWQLTEDEICGTNGNTAASFNIFVPQCSDSSMNYYAKNGVPIDGLDEADMDIICEAISTAAQKGQRKIYLYINDSLDFADTVDNLFYSGDHIFFDCIDTVNQELQGVSVDRDNVSIRKSEEMSVVTVYLEYI
ncbi:MAG: hypothetical protein IJC86_04825 [Clostridia bacterium]|nr:hypothetical protein [Clostridia bacterium]